MRKLQILRYPNKFLRKKCRVIRDITPRRQDKIRQMFKLMYQNDGMGLAATQVGWNARVFVMNVTGNPEDELVFINPVVIESGGDLWAVEEGCLSFPGLVGVVERNSKVVIQAQNIDGDLFELKDDSWAGRCALHEIDHLSGVLIIDRAKKIYKSNPEI